MLDSLALSNSFGKVKQNPLIGYRLVPLLWLTKDDLKSGSYSTGWLEPIAHDYQCLARFGGFSFRIARNIQFETCGMEKI